MVSPLYSPVSSCVFFYLARACRISSISILPSLLMSKWSKANFRFSSALRKFKRLEAAVMNSAKLISPSLFVPMLSKTDFQSGTYPMMLLKSAYLFRMPSCISSGERYPSLFLSIDLNIAPRSLSYFFVDLTPMRNDKTQVWNAELCFEVYISTPVSSLTASSMSAS